MKIGRTIRWAANYTPWISNCFPQAITAAILLRCFSIPYGLYFGLCKDDNETVKAHAWVTSGSVKVTGGNGFLYYKVIVAYVYELPIEKTIKN